VEIEGITIETIQGDISATEADAIVNAANSELWMGAGVAGAIKRRGGAEIEREARAKGPIPVGEAVVTGAGRLRARWVIHAAAMGPDLATDEVKIRAATRNALKRAMEIGAISVAFPSIGTGVGGLPLDQAARAMIDVMAEHAHMSKSPSRIVIVLFSEDAKEAFDHVLGNR